MRKNSIKNTRVNGEVQKVLSEIIRGEIKDPRISPMTSVVQVQVAPDLKTCKAYISVLGDEEARKNTLQGLQSAVGYIRRQLRSKAVVDVSEVASYFGGGGHVRAAGVTMKGTFHDIVNNLTLHIDHQLTEQDKQ